MRTWNDYKAEQEAKKLTSYDVAHRSNLTADKILEIYRRTPYRTTALGNRVAWDEPEKQKENEISDRIQRLMKAKQQLQQQKLAKNKLKSRNAVPLKAGKPMFEQQILEEDLNRAIQLIRTYYHSGKTMKFKDWISVMEKILDEF
jgi:hypothetical protein